MGWGKVLWIMVNVSDCRWSGDQTTASLPSLKSLERLCYCPRLVSDQRDYELFSIARNNVLVF